MIKGARFEIVANELSCVQILSRTLVLPKPKTIQNQYFCFHETKSVCLHCMRLSFTEISVTFKV